MHRNFLSEIEAFLVAYGVTATEFGVQAMNDPGFVHTLRRGRSPRLVTAEKVRAFMASHPAAVQVALAAEAEAKKKADTAARAAQRKRDRLLAKKRALRQAAKSAVAHAS